MEMMVSLCCVWMHVPSLVLRYVPFREKVSKRQTIQLLVWYGAGLFLDFVLCLWILKTGRMTITFYKCNLLLYCEIMGIVNILIIKGYTKEHLFSFGMTALIVWLTFAIAVYITDKIGYKTLNQGLLLETAVGFALYLICYPWYRRLMRKTVTPFLDMDGGNYWNHIWFIPIAMFLSGLLSQGPEEYTATVHQLISRLLLGLATLLLCRRVAQDYRKMQEKLQMHEQLEMQKKYYQALTESVETERQLRHNFKYQLAALKGFLNTGNREELQQYCNHLEAALLNITEIPRSGNAAADGILYHYACRAKEQKINFSVYCKLNQLSVSDTDLCCLLGNALENAVTACMVCKGERFITVSSEKSEDMLLLTVDNSFDGILLKKGGKFLSRKRQNQEGIGIRSMREICEKYGGVSRFEAEENQFEASFLLHL